jgi:galactokinase
MWKFSNPVVEAEDSERFLTFLNAQTDFFETDKTVFAGRAPGRLDLMGGIADYSGALVLELPLGVGTWAAAQATDEPYLDILSFSESSNLFYRLPLAELSNASDHAAVQKWLSADTTRRWTAYPAGVWRLLQQKFGFPANSGGRLLIYSEVPVGKGVSSSAALEVATLNAFLGLYNLEMSDVEQALLCQRAENVLVGAPCGVMDQMTVACGKRGELLSLLCQPAELQSSLKLPDSLAVWGLDSGIRHSVGGADYTSVRVGAFMGYRLIAQLAGLPVQPKNTGKVHIDDKLWGGYLANVTPSEWESFYRDELPKTLSGREFLDIWGGTTDPVTDVDPARTYAVRQPTAHPIYEHHRVQLFSRLLTLAQNTKDVETTGRLLGELMYQSHASYSRCGLGSKGTDRLVELVRQKRTSGLFGAKITGGGSGGTVAVLGRNTPEAHAAIENIVEQYAAENDYRPLVLSGTSPGAVEMGRLTLN